MLAMAALSVFVISIPGIGKAYSLDPVAQPPASCTVAHGALRATFAGADAQALCGSYTRTGWSRTRPRLTRDAACVARARADLAEVDGVGAAAGSACARLQRKPGWVADLPALHAKRAGRPLPVTVEVPSSSMEPTLHCARPAPGCQARRADLVVIDLVRASALRRGDIVLFNAPPLARVRCGAGGRFLKRVIGLPGETISERGGRIYVNGASLAEPYVRFRDNLPNHTWHVARGAYFLLGDNRPLSCDSRVWGAVPARNIIGRAGSVLRFR